MPLPLARRVLDGARAVALSHPLAVGLLRLTVALACMASGCLLVVVGLAPSTPGGVVLVAFGCLLLMAFCWLADTGRA